MTVNRKVTGTAVTMPVGIGIGCGISLSFTILGAGLVAKLISMEVLRETAIGYGAMMTVLLATVCGAVILMAGREKKFGKYRKGR